MASDLKEKTMPIVWSEDQKTVAFEDLNEGCLVKLDHYSLPQGFDTETIGIYKGTKETDDGNIVLVLETSGDRLKANTAGQLCESKSRQFYLPDAHIIKILARNPYVIFELFHSIGVLEVKLRNVRKGIEEAQSCLKGL